MSLNSNRKVELNFKSTEAQRRGFLSSPCLLVSPLNHPVAEWSSLFPEIVMEHSQHSFPKGTSSLFKTVRGNPQDKQKHASPSTGLNLVAEVLKNMFSLHYIMTGGELKMASNRSADVIFWRSTRIRKQWILLPGEPSTHEGNNHQNTNWNS